MGTLKERFEQLLHFTWSEFVDLENSGDATIDDLSLCSLIRACSDTSDISSIKLAFDRSDGLLETPIEIKVPKFYVRYMKATSIESGDENAVVKKEEVKTSYDPATAKLRETLREMRSMPRQIIGLVRGHKKRIDAGELPTHDPMVKSVIVANLLNQVKKGKFKAIELVFDQIDGKLTKTITLLGGEDVYVDNYNELVAPAHAFKNEDGIYIAEDKIMTANWLRGFAKSKKGLEVLAEGLEDA